MIRRETIPMKFKKEILPTRAVWLNATRWLTSIVILPRDLPSAVMSKNTFGFDMTVAKLLKRTPKDEKSFCFGCNNTEDLPYIQNGGVIAALLRMRTKHVVPRACRKCATYPKFSKHLFQLFRITHFRVDGAQLSACQRASGRSWNRRILGPQKKAIEEL